MPGTTNMRLISVTWERIFKGMRLTLTRPWIYREKLKIKKVSDELSETFDDMLDNY